MKAKRKPMLAVIFLFNAFSFYMPSMATRMNSACACSSKTPGAGRKAGVSIEPNPFFAKHSGGLLRLSSQDPAVGEVLARSRMSRTENPKTVLGELKAKFERNPDYFSELRQSPANGFERENLAVFDPEGHNVVVKHCGNAMEANYHGAAVPMYYNFMSFFHDGVRERRISPRYYFLVPLMAYGTIAVKRRYAAREERDIFLVMERISTCDDKSRLFMFAHRELYNDVNTLCLARHGRQFEPARLDLEVPQPFDIIVYDRTKGQSERMVLALPHDVG